MKQKRIKKHTKLFKKNIVFTEKTNPKQAKICIFKHLILHHFIKISYLYSTFAWFLMETHTPNIFKIVSKTYQNDTKMLHFGIILMHFGIILVAFCIQNNDKNNENGVPKTIKMSYTCHQFQPNGAPMDTKIMFLVPF